MTYDLAVIILGIVAVVGVFRATARIMQGPVHYVGLVPPQPLFTRVRPRSDVASGDEVSIARLKTPQLKLQLEYLRELELLDLYESMVGEIQELRTFPSSASTDDRPQIDFTSRVAKWAGELSALPVIPVGPTRVAPNDTGEIRYA